METFKGSVTSPKGFLAASTAAGIKYKDRTDMAMIYSKTPCVCAGTFTTNIVKAAPVKWDMAIAETSDYAPGRCHQCRYRQCLYRSEGHESLPRDGKSGVRNDAYS